MAYVEGAGTLRIEVARLKRQAMTNTFERTRRETEAAQWFARLNTRTISLTDIESFKTWRADPDCRKAYEAVEAVWRKSERLAQDPDILAALARTPDRRRTTRRWLSPAGAAVAAAVACSVVAFGGYVLTRGSTYETGIGESRTVRLADGSRVQLDTDSRVDVRLSGSRRDLVLKRGQAMFDVAHDAARPFVVDAGTTQVTALGTRFDVRRLSEGARVTLLQGRVEVVANAAANRSWRMDAGQQIQISARAPTAKPQVVDVAAATSWTSGRLLFQETPLVDAVAEVNRYADHPIVLAAPSVATKPLSGAFDTGDPLAFAEAVSEIYGLTKSVRADGATVLTPRR